MRSIAFCVCRDSGRMADEEIRKLAPRLNSTCYARMIANIAIVRGIVVAGLRTQESSKL